MYRACINVVGELLRDTAVFRTPVVTSGFRSVWRVTNMVYCRSVVRCFFPLEPLSAGQLVDQNAAVSNQSRAVFSPSLPRMPGHCVLADVFFKNDAATRTTRDRRRRRRRVLGNFNGP